MHWCGRHSEGTQAYNPELSLPGRGGEAGSRAARASTVRTRPSKSLNKECREESLLSAGSLERLHQVLVAVCRIFAGARGLPSS